MNSVTSNDRIFEELIAEATSCTVCPRMHGSQRVIGRACGRIDSPLMFIGEAPGRLGADASAIPFHGDKAGDNFERLLDQVGISRYDFFITNAVLCNPKDETGNNATPTRREVENCSFFLKRQIELVNPKIIVTLGAQALGALKLVTPHEIELSTGVRKAHSWYGRTLIPLYHPGQRAMIYRSFLNQLVDYQFIAETLKRQNGTKKSLSIDRGTPEIALRIAKELLAKGEMSYFSLHKLFYLVEYEYYRIYKSRATLSYIIRQKDGPYVVDLHLRKIKKSLPEIKTWTHLGKLHLGSDTQEVKTLFTFNEEPQISDQLSKIIGIVWEKYKGKSDEQLKTAVYLSAPMRHILRREKYDKANMFNAPIDFSILSPRINRESAA